jgi:heme/copper-type cytochrome/quinol oxidase subunit 2
MTDETKENLEKLSTLWEEYKYRHEHCWKIIFQTTTAFVILSVIPYVQLVVVRGLGRVILIVPALAIVMILFASFVIWNELGVLYKVKRTYRKLQEKEYEINHGVDSERFKWQVVFYFKGLFVMGIINGFSIYQFWIPYIDELPKE